MKKEAVHKQDDDSWNVLLASKIGTVHHVRRISAFHCYCVMKSPPCDVCVHTFECSCADYGIRGVLCSHIHAVNVLCPKTIPDLEGDVVLETTSNIDIEKKRHDLSNFIQQDKKLQERNSKGVGGHGSPSLYILFQGNPIGCGPGHI